MEYPDGKRFSNGRSRFAQLVQDHEIAHSYFPFIWESMKTMHLWMRVGQQH
jgi:hypothetical protein